MAINGPQRKVLAAVLSIETSGHAATVEGIAGHIGFIDTDAISVWLERLIHDDYLSKDDATGGYSITASGRYALTAEN